MICPHCGSPCGEGDRFCSYCGFHFPEGNSPETQKRTGSLWPPFIIMIIMIAISILVYVLTAPARIPKNDLSETPWFHMEGNTLFFNASAYSGSSELVVPEMVNGVPVLTIGENCFADCDGLTTVLLPDGLVEIENGAFSYCSSLRGIFLPESVTFIGSGAFAYCTDLEAICLSSPPSYIGDDAFLSCDSLHYIFFPGNYQDWTELYQGYINPYTYVCCYDGVYPQGGVLP